MSKYDAILIPGGGITNLGQVPPWVAKRLDKAFSEFSGNEILITLSKGTTHKPPFLDINGTPISESRAGALYLNEKGVPLEQLRVEEISLDTIGNAYFARILYTVFFNLHNLLIVTSEFHMPRTKEIFEWIYRLPWAAHDYDLTFETVENVGMEKEDLDTRIEKENSGLQSVQTLRQRITSYEQLHSWIYSEHKAYMFKLDATDTLTTKASSTY